MRRLAAGALAIACVLLSAPSAARAANLPQVTAPVWTAVTVPQPSVGSAYLESVSAPRGGDVWAAGYHWFLSSTTGDVVDETYALLGKGNSWQVVPTPNPGGTLDSGDDQLFGVDGTSAGNAWMVGDQLTSSGVQRFYSVAIDSSGGAVAVGFGIQSSGTAQALVAYRNT